MIAFVVEQEKEWNKSLLKESSALFRFNTCNYAKFLLQKLAIWMLVPCKLVDGVWVVLENPFSPKGFKIEKNSNSKEWFEYCKEYQEAKEHCLFEGYDGTIEQLENLIKLKITVENMVKYDLQLTPTAVKQIGL